mmetsp:Transcript_13740/g.13806  ORF Transcript_13740/g.13806 Transcript_13740/m.13806 type:complete len:88 (-) Transcript_13740:305-568(-)
MVLVIEAARRRSDLSNRSNLPLKEVETFLFEFSSMRRMMAKNMKGMDIDGMSNDPAASVTTPVSLQQQRKKEKKMKPTRGGGAGFGR